MRVTIIHDAKLNAVFMRGSAFERYKLLSHIPHEDRFEYTLGERPPNFKLPAIPVRVGYQPSGTSYMDGVPYWWVTTSTMLWTFWRGYGMFEEHRK